MIVFLRPKRKATLQWEGFNISFEEMEICSVNSCSIDGAWDEIRTWEVGLRRELKTLSSLWALILEPLGHDGDRQESSGDHRRSLTQCSYIKNKMISSEIMKPEKKLKNNNLGRVYSVLFSGHGISLKWEKTIYKTLRLMYWWVKKLLNWNYLGWDRIVCPWFHHLLTICSPVSTSTSTLPGPH